MQHDYHTLHAFFQSRKACTSAQASTSADECLPRTRATPRFALEQHSKNQQEAGRKVPATISAIANAVRWEQIMRSLTTAGRLLNEAYVVWRADGTANCNVCAQPRSKMAVFFPQMAREARSLSSGAPNKWRCTPTHKVTQSQRSNCPVLGLPPDKFWIARKNEAARAADATA